MKDFWSINYAHYDVVMVFGVEDIMSRLNQKLLDEQKFNRFIICYRFPLPNTLPIIKENELYVYKL